MIYAISIIGSIFLLAILCVVYKESSVRYRYEDQEKEIWAGFNSKGLVFKKVTIKTLVEDPEGQYYSNGRQTNE